MCETVVLTPVNLCRGLLLDLQTSSDVQSKSIRRLGNKGLHPWTDDLGLQPEPVPREELSGWVGLAKAMRPALMFVFKQNQSDETNIRVRCSSSQLIVLRVYSSVRKALIVSAKSNLMIYFNLVVNNCPVSRTQ